MPDKDGLTAKASDTQTPARGRHRTQKVNDSSAGTLASETAAQREGGNLAVQRVLGMNDGDRDLEISKSSDPDEQEAQRLADEVVSPVHAHRTQRDDASRESGRAAAVPTPGAPGVGSPLEADARSSMQARFGRDFSTVRVHADARAAESARAVKARAFTVGESIVFGAGEYAPTTTPGRRLVAHELVHVVQQRRHASTSRTRLQRFESPEHVELALLSHR